MKKLFLLISAALLISIVLGCSSSDTVSLDTTRPTVVSVNPSDLSSNVPVSTTISVTFSESMDKASSEGALRMNAAAPTGTFSWSGNTMIFTPGANLDYSKDYTCYELAGPKDAAGNSLQYPYVWAFTTIGASSLGIIIEDEENGSVTNSGSFSGSGFGGNIPFN
jgi:hypothetical protein